MPNWCENVLYVKGDKSTLLEFIQKVKNSPEQAEKRKQGYDILGNLYPTPQELVDTASGWSNDEDVQAEREKQYEANRAKYGHSDWYGWNNANWGTKWGDCETYLADDEEKIGDFIEFQFQTAWSPPLEGISKIASMFPTLGFALSYSEEGMGFFGFTTFDSDGTVHDTCKEVDKIEGYDSIDPESPDAWIEVSDLMMEARSDLEVKSGWW
jgi:hypothetical protein